MTYQTNRRRIKPIQAARPTDNRAATMRAREATQAQIDRIRAEASANKTAKS